MKKLIIISMLVFVLTGCKYNSHELTNADILDDLIKKSSVKYDLRTFEECEAGHIPGFMCIDIGGKTTVDQAIYNITNQYSEYKNDDIIILIGLDTKDAKEAADAIASHGYKNVYYFSGGYNEYVKQKGDDFEPEVGCDC